MDKPEISYTKEYEVNLAYQVIGTGSVDILLIPGWSSNIDLIWGQPEFNWFVRQLSKTGRVIIMDKAGTGLSDRLEVVQSMDQRVEEVYQVLKAVDSKKVILYGRWDGASIAIAFASRYPQRVISLILLNPFIFGRRSQGYEWVMDEELFRKSYENIRFNWGKNENYINLSVPEKNGGAFSDWVAFYYRNSCSPTMARISMLMYREIDLLNDLPLLDVPTLVMSIDSDVYSSYKEAEYIAKSIRNSFLVNLKNTDVMFWATGAKEVVHYMHIFMNGYYNELQMDIVISHISTHFPNNTFSECILKHIRENIFDRNFGVKSMCETLAMSERQLQRKFKQTINQSPIQFITYVRLLYAQKLLTNHPQNIAKVAFMSGFSDASYFSKCFKKAFGVTPSTFGTVSQVPQ